MKYTIRTYKERFFSRPQVYFVSMDAKKEIVLAKEGQTIKVKGRLEVTKPREYEVLDGKDRTWL